MENKCFHHVGRESNCGEVLTGPSDIIVSPDKSGSGSYDNFVDCMWIIQLDDDSVIVFEVKDLDIQMDSFICKADYLEVTEP